MPFRIRDMWSLFIITCITTVACQQQNSRRPEPHDNGHGWDIRLAVPGEPGGDYPTLNAIPRTSFSCSRKSPGYYADVETGCQVFRVCTLGSTYGFQSFLCPNGTLFNQEVFVCDWWMNVKCDRSQQLFNDNREKFGNLKLGPQLMKDIKKMLTHPMRNPYDKSIMKSNLIVMQEYKPPSGQLFPNGALIAGPERPPSNIYIPAKQRTGNFAQNSFISGDLSYAASTPSSQYIPPSYNLFGNPREVDGTQQRLSIQNSNTHTGMIRASNSEYSNNNRLSQSSFAHNQNQNKIQRNFQSTSQNMPNGQLQRQNQEYNPNTKPQNQVKRPGQLLNNVQSQQFTYNLNPNGQLVQKNNIPQFNVAKQHLESPNGIQPTGKTLKFSRIVQKSTSGNPKSRITFKTWIVRPSKTARLAVEPTPYTYNKPTDSPSENKLVDTAIYEESSTTEKQNPDAENIPYVYNKPTPSSRQIIAVEETPFIYLPPTAPTLSNQILYTSTKPQASRQSNSDLPPTTYKPASRFYIPPSESSLGLSRQYLNPDVELPETNNYESAQLTITPTPAVSKNEKLPSFSVMKQSYINTNHNNLTFADILTKEKLDITVNDIVKKTNEILNTATPDELNQYRQNNEDENNLDSNHLSPDFDNNPEEKLALQPPQTIRKNEKLISTPSTELEPPEVMPENNYQNSNRLINLPFFTEPPVPTNTIERTVSLKVTIPETIANYLFKNHSENSSDNLEILNTGSSNYLVVTNNHFDENNGGLIPIGRIIWDKNINVSNSQALVFSILADSLNAVKEYSNIAKQNLVQPTSTQLPITNINNEDISEITDKVARLTSSQFANNSPNNLIISSTNNGQYRGNNRQVTELTQSYPLNHQPKSQYVEQNSLDPIYSSRLQRLSKNDFVNLQKNTEQIYSGQLYQLSVPEVTSKIYNVPNPVQSSKIRQKSELSRDSQLNLNIPENINKRPDMDEEVLRSESSLYPPVRQELPRIGESIKFNKLQNNYENIFAENYLNTDTAITAHVEDKIKGSLPHPLEENKLVTYEKNKSYYLYTKLDDDNNNNIQASNSVTQTNERSNLQNEKFIRSNNLEKRLTYELFPAISYELADERKKQPLYNEFKVNDFFNQDNAGKIENINRRQDNLVTGVDFTILHPSSKKQVEQRNNANTILYRGPSSYLAPQTSVGSLGQTQQTNSNARIEQFEDNNGYSKTVPARQFSF